MKGEKNVRKKHKKLTACAVAAMLGLSCMVYPVHAEEAPSSGQTDTGGLLEVDETAVPVEESTEPQATPTPTPEADEPEPVTQEQTESEADREEPTSEPVETEPEATEQTNGEAEPQEQIQNAAVPYANTGDFVVTGGTYGTDYTYDGTLHILTSTKLTITTNGKATSSKITGDTRGGTYNLVFNNLSINSPANDTMILIRGELNLTLYGNSSVTSQGIGLSVGNLSITSESTGNLSLSNNPGGDIECASSFVNYGKDYEGNLKVNGGSLSYDTSDIKGTISTSGTGTINGQTYPEKTPAPTPTFTTTQTASSITVNLTNYQSDYGQVQYKWDNGDWGTSNILSNSSANASHTVSVRYMGQGKYTQSDEQKQDVKTKSADYTISIPASPDSPLVAGKEESTSSISVNQERPFDLGYNGQVDVKVKNDDKVTDKAELNLTRQNDTENHKITSALLVNNKVLGDINKSVATFRAKNDSPVTVSFAKPTETDIPAGTYNGTITFEVSYSEQ